MVLFGGYQLRNPQAARNVHTWDVAEKNAPLRSVDYRGPHYDLGRTIEVDGVIRETYRDQAQARLAEIRNLSDGTIRLLDLEDGDTTLNGLLGDIEWKISVGDWFPAHYYIYYTLSFLEAAA